ncbi:MAG: hypothetical protein HOL04_06730 [Gammaproteobacteria bacterium]|jgi:hypothetical protein|nr:hypothetical protein [Gammaproteobacteria bacterium]MBT4608267.1 hypothetical protein [Thiotrichales bacterium]MBT3471615.1 hypothetical protein [Gammaproteobacteria bacterium]MBT3966693.1 hypothetical protein [Gammaproteobacteria bacterium]MBT4080121.1 hypothetical protein [Gammaproteobacteria bacterium]
MMMKTYVVLLTVATLTGCSPAPIEPAVLFKFSGDIQGTSEKFTGELINVGHGFMDVNMHISNGDTCTGKIKGGMLNGDRSGYTSQPFINCTGSISRDFQLNLERRGDVWGISGSGAVRSEYLVNTKVEYLGRVVVY